MQIANVTTAINSKTDDERRFIIWKIQLRVYRTGNLHSNFTGKLTFLTDLSQDWLSENKNEGKNSTVS